MTEAPHFARRPTIPAAALAWAAAAAAYAGMRIAALLSLPVGGLELWSLAGAWQARAGFDDPRYVPTLFQAISAALLHLSESETPSRLLALAAALTVPWSLYALRRSVGEPAAIVALLILAFDPLQLALGPAASVAAFDLPLAFGSLALLHRLGPRAWLLGLLGFLWATSGPAGLPLLFAAVLAAPRVRAMPWLHIAAAGVGSLAGVALASAGFGFGWQGVTMPPFDTFALGYNEHWSSETSRRLFALYAWGPALVAAAGLAIEALSQKSRAFPPGLHRAVAAWFPAAAAWLFLAGSAHDLLPVSAVTAAAAIPAGSALVRLIDRLGEVDWRNAGWPLAAALGALLVIAGPLLDWARLDRVGRSAEVAAVIVLAGVAAGGITLVARSPRNRPAAILPFAAAAVIPWLAGGFAVATGSPNEPLPSPVTTLQAAEIRDIVTGPAWDPAGVVAIHPDIADALTWPLRGSRGLVVSSRVPPNASIVIWPTGGSPPDGFRTFEGRWALLRERRGPEPGFLDYLRWLANRNTLPVRDLQAADGLIGLRTTAGNAALVVGYPLWGWAATRLGHERALALASAGLGLYPIMTGLATSAPWLVPAAVVWGLFAGGIDVTLFEGLLHTAPPARRAHYVALNTAIANLIAFVAPILGAALAGPLGIPAVLFLAGALHFL
ncbi:MAG: MFS transporter, partial [Dehalococcoidia bacterium]|nr:MFS transporter [Dehalococcoidia bacterium]